MKLLIYCQQCYFAQPSINPPPATVVAFSDSGRYETTCINGHKSVTVLQQQKFEVLFEIGANAILDGYYREAVTSFSASLERFHEVAIKCILRKSGVTEDAISSAWKLLAKQSERQLGAFMLLWLNQFGTTPTILPDHDTSFRNDVVHKGRIPTRDEAVGFGEAALAMVRTQMRTLLEKLPDQFMQGVNAHLSSARASTDAGQLLSTMYNPMALGIHDGSAETLEAWLQHLSRFERS